MSEVLKKKVIGSDIEFGMGKESLKDLIVKLDCNYQILYSITKEVNVDNSYLEILEAAFKSNLDKIFERIDDKNNGGK